MPNSINEKNIDTNTESNSQNSFSQNINSQNQANNSINDPIMTTTSSNAISQDSKNMGLLNWLGCLFTGFLVPLVLLLVKSDDKYVQRQAKEALNFCISMFIVYVGLWIMAVILGIIFAPLAIIPFIFMGLLGLAFLAFCVMGAVKCSSGDNYRVPFNIRLLK